MECDITPLAEMMMMSAVKEEEEVSDPEKSTGHHRQSGPAYLLIEDKPSPQTIEQHLNPTFILSQSL
jgi:hypothetical protein